MENKLTYRQMQDANICAILSKLAYHPRTKHPHIAISEEEDFLEFSGYSITHLIENNGSEFIVADSDDTRIFAIRGTEKKLNDVIKDFKAQVLINTPLGRIGAGFRLYSSNIDHLIHNLIPHNGKRIIFTGHSLGAAAATDIAMRFKNYNNIMCRLITFGCPRVGDRVLAWNINRLFPYPLHQRWVHANDIVTKIPFQLGRFRHANAMQYITTNGIILTSPSIASVFFNRYGWFKNSLFRWASDQIKDHRIDNYINHTSVS